MDRYKIEGGEVIVYRQGLMTVIEAETAPAGEQVLRLAAKCGKEERALGVFMPDNGRLTMRKKLSRADMENLGLSSIEGFSVLGSAAQAESEIKKEPRPTGGSGRWFKSRDELEWVETAEPEKMFADKRLSRSARGVKGALMARYGEILLLAIPMNSERPFPPLPVFIYGEPESIAGRSYVVFRLVNGELVG